MKKILSLATLLVATVAFGQTSKVYFQRGGATLVVASGGTLQIDEGATFTTAEALSFALDADENVNIDASTTAQTQTAGALDVNFASVTADASGINLAATMNTGTATGANVYGSIITLTADDADGDLFGIKISGAATTNAAAGSYEYLIGLDCAENTTLSCTDGILITSSGIDNGMTDAIDVSASNITNAVNVGSNLIVGGNSDYLDVGATNNTLTFTVDSTNTATFVGADASGAANTTLDTAGAGVITVGSADVTNVQITAEDLTGTISDDVSIIAGDDIEISGNSAGSIINIGTNNDGNEINIGTNNTAKDTINIGSALDDVVIVGAAGAEAGAGVVAAERCMGAICQTVFTFTAATLAITDPGAAAAYGGLKIYDFPAGYINRLGVVADITLTEASATIAADFDGDISFGSTAAEATATLHNPTTEDDWVLTAATTQAVASVAAADTQSAVTQQTICDGHTTACDLYLNVEIDDADITTGAADALTIDGTVTVTWINLGDNG